MKRTLRDRNQPYIRPRVPGQTRTSFSSEQTNFRHHTESDETLYLARNNHLQLPHRINRASATALRAQRGHVRANATGLNQHQRFEMNRPFRGRELNAMARFLLPNRFRSAVSHRPRSSNPRQIPSRQHHQFRESQSNVKFPGPRLGHQRNANMRYCSNVSTVNSNRPRHREQGHRKNRLSTSMRRKWYALPESSCHHADEITFSVVTYNILSDSLLYENIFLYEECDKNTLHWGYRKEKLLAELLGYEADILCLQEVDANHYEKWFAPKLSAAGYTGLFKQRTGGKPDGCALLFRSAKFTLIKHKLVKYFTPKVQVLDKDNVGIVSLLKANSPDVKNPFICVATTHLLFNKKRGDIKLAQLAYLLAEINDLALLSQDDQKKIHCPIILCGDLNSLPYSPLYNFLVTGRLEYSIRSAAVISGQLLSSEVRRGPSARLIRTPLLPWEFGITTSCQWREERGDLNDGESTRRSNSEKKENREQSDTEHTSQRCGINCTRLERSRKKMDEHCECRQVPSSGGNSEQQHRENHMPVFSQGSELERKRSRRIGCQCKRNFDVDDLAKVIESVGPDNEVEMAYRENSSSRHAVGGSESISSCIGSTNWATGRESKAISERINSSNDVVSCSSYEEVTENRNGTCNRDREFKKFTESSRPTRKAGNETQHSTATSCEQGWGHTDYQKAKHNTNGTISIPWQFSSVYPHRFSDGAPEVTTFHSKACCNVDYIFYTAGTKNTQYADHSEHVQSGTLTLLGRLELMRRSDIVKLLPNHVFPSDHLSLHARFKLT